MDRKKEMGGENEIGKSNGTGQQGLAYNLKGLGSGEGFTLRERNRVRAYRKMTAF